MDGFQAVVMRSRSKIVWFMGAAVHLFGAGCGAPRVSQRVFLVAEQRTVKGAIQAGKEVDLSRMQMNVISPEGVRTNPQDSSFDPQTGAFSFTLANSDLHRPDQGSVVDNILRMGGALPLVEFPGGGSLRRVQSYARFEFIPKTFAEVAYQIVPYLQEVLPLAQNNALRGVDRIQFSAGVNLAKTGFARVQILNSEGVPIPNATVAAVTDGQFTIGVPLWHDKSLHPVLTNTNADGVAFIGPIDPAENSKFKVLAYAPGYCSFLTSGSFIFSPRETRAPVVRLIKCDSQTAGASNLYPVFPAGLKYFKVTENGESRLKLHTNSENVVVQIHQSDLRFRGLRVAAYEATRDYEKRGEPIEKIFDYPSGAGEFEVALGKVFKTTNQENGNFVIEISRIPGSLDGELLDKSSFPDLLIYGYKNVIPPPLAEFMRRKVSEVAGNFSTKNLTGGVKELSTFKIRSVTGFENVVPGLPGGRFEMSSDKCGEGYAIGFAIDLFGISRTQPVFKDCVGNKVVFSAEEAQFVAKKSVIEANSSPQKWYLYLRDPYGNYVKDPVETGDTASVTNVFIDSGVPKFGSEADSHAVLTTSFQIAALEQNNSFPDNPDNKIDKSDLLDGSKRFAIRFAKELTASSALKLTCSPASSNDLNLNGGGTQGVRAEINGLDGMIYRDELNNLIYRETEFTQVGFQITHYKIGATSESVRLESGKAPGDLPGLVACRKMEDGVVVPNQIVFKATDIVFPQDPSGAAEFYMSGMDAAGLVSEPGRYQIPRCTETTTSFCWQD